MTRSLTTAHAVRPEVQHVPEAVLVQTRSGPILRYRERRDRFRSVLLIALLAALVCGLAGCDPGSVQPQDPVTTTDPSPNPAPVPGTVRNGSIVAIDLATQKTYQTVVGDPVDLPSDLAPLAGVRFTASGSAVTYLDTDGQISLAPLGRGELARVRLARCPRDLCDHDLSPDGRTLALTVDGALQLVTVTSERIGTLAEDVGYVFSPRWSPDGSGSLPSLAGQCACLGQPAPSLAWSPDGQHLAVAKPDGPGGAAGIYLVGPDSTGWELVLDGYYSDVQWQPRPG